MKRIRKSYMVMSIVSCFGSLVAMHQPNPELISSSNNRMINLGFGQFKSFAYHPERDQIAYAYAEADGKNTVHIWNPSQGSDTTQLAGHTDTVAAVAYCYDVHESGVVRLASGSYDTTINLWDIEYKDCYATLSGHDKAVVALAYCKVKQLLASGSEDTTIRLWNLKDNKSVATLAGHTQKILSLAFPADQPRLLSVSDDRTAKEWDVETGTCLYTYQVKQDDGIVNFPFHVSCSPEGTLAALGCWENDIQLFDTRTGRLVTIFDGARNAISGTAFAPEGTHLAATDYSGYLRFWDMRHYGKYQESRMSELPLDAVIYNHDGSSLAIAAHIRANEGGYTNWCIKTIDQDNHSNHNAKTSCSVQ